MNPTGASNPLLPLSPRIEPVDRGLPALQPGGFSHVLELARSGGASTGRAVRAAPGLVVDLTDEQWGRLAEAADRAEAAGARRALVSIDGQLLRLDVAKREVTERVEALHADVVAGIDAFVTADSPGESPSIGDSAVALLRALAG
ncbi:MAG: hypothetical protein H6811_09360 [Phycisphaeraceae bacterium]|nr:hypothetical protein [Phycisphaeraceae bacterium]